MESDIYYHCRGIYFFQVQPSLSDDEGNRFFRITGKFLPDHISQETVKFIVPAVRTSNLSEKKMLVLLFSVMGPILNSIYSYDYLVLHFFTPSDIPNITEVLENKSF